MAQAPGRAATIALAAAGLIALGAVGVTVFRSGGETPAAEAAGGNVQSAASLDELIAGMQQRLRQDPDNDAGWFNLGLLYREARRFDEAAQAFRRAMELRPRNADYAGYLAETLFLLSRGSPSAEAERMFRRVLALQPGHPQARYYLATLRDLRGDHAGAIDDLIALLRDARADSPWEPQVRSAALNIARTNAIELGDRLPPQPRPAAGATAAIPGPTREQMEAARAIPPGQQDAMVDAMVERLATRLLQNPRDADGWIRLMRSRMVLNEPQAAAAALRSALAAFQGDAATQQRLRTAAQELAVPAG